MKITDAINEILKDVGAEWMHIFLKKVIRSADNTVYANFYWRVSGITQIKKDSFRARLKFALQNLKYQIHFQIDHITYDHIIIVSITIPQSFKLPIFSDVRSLEIIEVCDVDIYGSFNYAVTLCGLKTGQSLLEHEINRIYYQYIACIDSGYNISYVGNCLTFSKIIS